MQIVGRTWLNLVTWTVGHEVKVSMTYISRSSDFVISWRLFDVCTSYFGSMNQYDLTFDLKINVGHCDLYSIVQWFCLISWRLFDVWTILFGIMSQYDPKFDLKINIGHYDLYLMIQWFCLISWRLCDVCTSYFGSMNQYDQTFDLKINVGHWSIFHGPVILPYILMTIWCMNIIIWDYESVWPKVLPKNKYRSLWPIIRPSGFALYFEDCLMYEHHTLGLRVSMTWRLTSK